MNKNIGFIGWGNIAQAMISGICKSNLVSNDNMMVSNASTETLELIKNKYGILATDNNKEVVKFADILFLSIKTEKYEEIIDHIKDHIKEDATVVTISPAINLKSMEVSFGRKLKAVRAMPNTPTLVGEGMSVICHNEMVNKDDLKDIIKIFQSFGKAEIIDESLMDIIPAISGSSPAYAYMFIEAIAEGGVLRGLPWKKAYKLAAQSVLGAAKMVLETDQHPIELRDKVCSPGGATIEALYSLEKNNFKGTVIEAMERCTEKVIEMSSSK